MTNVATRKIVRPLADRVLVRPSKPEDTSRGGLMIPEVAKEQPMEGTVVAVGPDVPMGPWLDTPVPDVTQRDSVLRPGDLVLYGKYAGADVMVNDEKLLMLKLADVLGVIEDE